MNEGRRVALALGSNMGDRLAHLQLAVQMISETPGVFDVVASSVYETAPVGGPAQPKFLNAVIRAESTLSPADLLVMAHRCEQAAGRVRSEHWGPRSLDVDVLAVSDLRSDDAMLTLPHPRALERAFVLVPWCEVDAEFVVAGQSVADWVATVDTSGVVQSDEQLVGAS